jgi:pilus assembly protein CpaF
VQKLATLPLLAGGNISRDFVVPTVAACVDYVVHCAQTSPGVRKVVEVCWVSLDRPQNRLVTSHVC